MDLDKIRETEGYIRKVGSVNLDAEMEFIIVLGQRDQKSVDFEKLDNSNLKFNFISI